MKRLRLGKLTGLIFVILASLGVLSTASAYVTPRIKPPAPGPEFLSEHDYVQLKAVSDAIKKKQFAYARAKAAMVQDPIAKSLGQWMYFAAEDPAVSITAADAFLDAHPQWPSERRIRTHVEKRLKNSTPTAEIFALFESREPVTGEGKIQLARAHYSNGAKDAGDRYLKDAWINHNFRVSEERRILSAYGGKLTKEDHNARVDRLLWARQVTNARRIFSRLSSTDRRAAEARAAMLMRAASAPALYTKLSQDQQLDSGMLHAAVRYYRRSGDEQFAISMSDKAPSDPALLRNGGRWWDERQLLMRWSLKNGRFHDAYKVAANHGLEPGSDFAEAEFNAGWIALRFLNEPARAENHFLALASAVATPISVSRAYYWLGRSAAARGQDDRATAFYKVAARHFYSYYGQLAAEELGGDALTQKFAETVTSTPADRALFTSRPTVAALRMLADLDLDYEFMVFAYHTDDLLERPGEYVELANLTNSQGAPHLTVRAGKVAVRKDAFAADVSYPLVFVPDETNKFVAPEVVLGLSRQESEFNPRAFSHAGARGMMQLIPSTAQITARKEGLRYSRSALLDDPVYNMTIGSAHLSHLLDRFDGSLIMTFAAYNAGRSRVDRWSSEYGDPRGATIDPIDWVELIPFSETRNYVMRVLENVQVYRGRLQNAAIPGRLANDLEIGGNNNRVAQAPRPALITVSATQATIAPLPASTLTVAEEYRATKLAAMLADPNTLAPETHAQAVETDDAKEASSNKRQRRSWSRRRNRDNVDKDRQAPVEKTDIAEVLGAPTITADQITENEPIPETKTANLTQSETPAPVEIPSADLPVNTLTPIETPTERVEETVAEAVETTVEEEAPTIVAQETAVVAQDQSAPRPQLSNTVVADVAATNRDTTETASDLAPPVTLGVPTSALIGDESSADNAATIAANDNGAAPPTIVDQPTAVVVSARVGSSPVSATDDAVDNFADAAPAAAIESTPRILNSDEDFDDDAIARAIAAGEAAMARERAEEQMAAAARDLAARRTTGPIANATPEVGAEIAKNVTSSVAATIGDASPVEEAVSNTVAETASAASIEQCQTTRETLVEEDQGEPRAADLNAAMLAELQDDDDGC